MNLETVKKQPIKKHNGIISFWKFAFSIMIVMYHLRSFSSKGDITFFSTGYIAVEFFFLVSGFLMAKAALKKRNEENNENLGKETFQFIIKKVKSFLPYIIFSCALSLILENIYKNMDIYKNISSIWNFLLLRMSGLKGTIIIEQAWYISAMLLCMIILYPLLRKYKYNFIYIVAPLIVILGFGWMNQNYGNLRSPQTWIGFTYKGVIRAFIELSFGSILYVVCEKLKNVDFTNFGKLVITLVEISGFLLCFGIAQFCPSTKYDYIEVIILSISIVLAFSEKTLEYKLFSNKFFFWLERFSLPIYLCHTIARDFAKHTGILSSMTYYHKTAFILLITFVISLVCMYLIEYLRKRNFFFGKLKKLLVVEK